MSDTFNRLITKIKGGDQGEVGAAKRLITTAPTAAKAGMKQQLQMAIDLGKKTKGKDTGTIGPELAQERLQRALGKTGRIGEIIKEYENWSTQIQQFSANSAKGAGQITQQLQMLQRRQTEMGISMTDTMKSVQAAMKSYAGVVTPAWKKDFVAVTKQISVYKKLGIAAHTSIELFNTFGATLGKSRSEVTKTSQVLNKFAQTTGQSYAQVWEGFNQNVGNFMDILDSKDMTRQTLLFQTRARRMGISVGGMMSNLERFETLDGAQQAAGKINAVMGTLGGSFDAVKAASMDYPERMEYMSKSIQSVMGRIEQSGPRASRAYMKALKDAFGMDSKQMRAMISYKPGAALPAELQAAGGVVGALTPAETERAAKEAATLSERATAVKEAREAFMLEIVPKSIGLTSMEIINNIKLSAGKIDNTLVQVGTSMAEGLVKKFMEGVTTSFNKQNATIASEVKKHWKSTTTKTVGGMSKVPTVWDK